MTYARQTNTLFNYKSDAKTQVRPSIRSSVDRGMLDLTRTVPTPLEQNGSDHHSLEYLDCLFADN